MASLTSKPGVIPRSTALFSSLAGIILQHSFLRLCCSRRPNSEEEIGGPRPNWGGEGERSVEMPAVLDRTEDSTAAYRELVDLHASLVKVRRTHEPVELNKVISDGTLRKLRELEAALFRDLGLQPDVG
jgi:hypothetical protein